MVKSIHLQITIEPRNIKSLKMFVRQVTFLIIVISIIFVESRPHRNKVSIKENKRSSSANLKSCKIQFFPLKWFKSSTQYKNQMKKSQNNTLNINNVIVPVRFCSSNQKIEVKILAPVTRNKLNPVRM